MRFSAVAVVSAAGVLPEEECKAEMSKLTKAVNEKKE